MKEADYLSTVLLFILSTFIFRNPPFFALRQIQNPSHECLTLFHDHRCPEDRTLYLSAERPHVADLPINREVLRWIAAVTEMKRDEQKSTQSERDVASNDGRRKRKLSGVGGGDGRKEKAFEEDKQPYCDVCVAEVATVFCRRTVPKHSA